MTDVRSSEHGKSLEELRAESRYFREKSERHLRNARADAAARRSYFGTLEARVRRLERAVFR